MTIAKLGFGMMRLPLLEKGVGMARPARSGMMRETFARPIPIDFAQLNKMVDLFLAKGFKYFDTSYVYHLGASEDAVKQALTSRHKREEYLLATKLPTFIITSYEQAETIFQEQLANCGVEYFDYYLLHNVYSQTYKENIEPNKLFDLAKEKKAAGKIKKLGFSFHDTPELLDKVLTEHPETDFVQISVNYLDWESLFIQSRKCYEVIRKHGKEVVIMGPVKGGTLSHVPDAAEKKMRAMHPDWSPATWALKFANSLDGVIAVLSGMTYMDEVEENVVMLQDGSPLNADEFALLEEVARELSLSGVFHEADYSKYPAFLENGMPVAALLQGYNHLVIQGDPTFGIELNYYKNFRYNAGIPAGESWIEGKVCDKEGNDITEKLKVAEQFFLENSF